MNVPPSIRILSAGAPKTGVRLCAEAWSDEIGRPFAIEFATAPQIELRVTAGQADADVVIAPLTAMEGFVAAGRIAAGSVVPIGAIATGVAVRAGAEVPDLSSAGRLRDALLAADRIIYNEASSGRYAATLIGRLGLADDVAAKTVRLPTGAAAMAYLAAADRHTRTIGFGQVTEIRLHETSGVRLVGPLPDEIGNITAYGAGVSDSSRDAEAAASLVGFMAGVAGRTIFTRSGVT